MHGEMPHRCLILALALAAVPLGWVLGADESGGGPGGPPFPNDSGMATVDVSKYPDEIQAGYRTFARRCSNCHSLSRSLNSQYLQLTSDEQKAAKDKEPDLFKDDKIWWISDTVWSDYVKKMQGKPGAIIRESELPKIVSFLVYDSKVRKIGDNRASWKTQRQALLDDFKKSNPKRYEEIFGKN